MKIISATPQHLPFLIQLNKEVQDLHIEWQPHVYKQTKINELKAWINQLFKDKNFDIFIGFQQNEALGCMITHLIKKPESPFAHAQSYLEIDQIVISHSHRNRGLGTQFVEAAKSHAHHLGLSQITLQVVAENQKALNWYKKLGFTPRSYKLSLKL